MHKEKYKKIYIALFLFLNTTMTYCQDTDIVRKGFADLSGYNFTKAGPVELIGHWEFYWMQWIDHTQISQAENSSAMQFHIFPSDWRDYIIDDKRLPAFGYASYHVRIKLPEKSGKLGLKLMAISSAYSLYVNGEKIFTMGTVGTSGETTLPKIKPAVIRLPDCTGELDLILHIANYNDIQGGTWTAVKLGIYDKLAAQERITDATGLILSGIDLFCILVLFFLILKYKKERQLIFLGCFAVTVLINTLCFDGMTIYLFFPDISYEVLSKFATLLAFNGGFFLTAVFGFRFPEESLKPLLYIALLLSALVLLCTIILDSYTLKIFPRIAGFEFYLSPFLIVSQLFVMYCLLITALAVKHKKAGAVFHFTTLLVFIFTAYAGFVGYMLFEVSLINIVSAGFILMLTMQRFIQNITGQVRVPVLQRKDDLKLAFIGSLALSVQEQNIMHALLDGKSAKDIASALKLSVRTVENYTYRIFRKCHIQSRAEILAQYYTYKLNH